MHLSPHSLGERRHPTKSEERSTWHHPGLHQIKTSTKTCKMSFMVRNKGKKVYVYALSARTIILPIVGPVSYLSLWVHSSSLFWFHFYHGCISDFIFITAIFSDFIFIMAVFFISCLSRLYCFVLINLSAFHLRSEVQIDLSKFVNGLIVVSAFRR